MQQELDTKLKVLQTLPFFDFFSTVSLIPLANLVECKTYTLHQKILAEGQEPKFFYLISKGRVKIIKQVIIKRNIEVVGLQKKENQKKLKFGKTDYTKPLIAEGRSKAVKEDKNKSIDQDQDRVSEMLSEEQGGDENNIKCADHLKKLYQDNETLAYTYQYDFGTLERGDFFMGRAIISEYIKLDPKLATELQINPNEKAKLSVISDAAETELYTIDRNSIHLLPAFLRKEMVDGLISRKEYDHEYTKEVAKHIRDWDNYKVDLLKKELGLKKIKKDQMYNR